MRDAWRTIVPRLLREITDHSSRITVLMVNPVHPTNHPVATSASTPPAVVTAILVPLWRRFEVARF